MAVIVVTGPPASGKSTWVRENAKLGDITIDYDTLAQALSPGLPTDPVEQAPHIVAIAQAARAAAINEAEHQHLNSPCADVYLVHAMPNRHSMNHYRKHGFRIVTIDPGYHECMRRAQLERTPRQQGIVHDWYDRRSLV